MMVLLGVLFACLGDCYNAHLPMNHPDDARYTPYLFSLGEMQVGSPSQLFPGFSSAQSERLDQTPTLRRDEEQAATRTLKQAPTKTAGPALVEASTAAMTSEAVQSMARSSELMRLNDNVSGNDSLISQNAFRATVSASTRLSERRVSRNAVKGQVSDRKQSNSTERVRRYRAKNLERGDKTITVVLSFAQVEILRSRFSGTTLPRIAKLIIDAAAK